MEEVKVIGANKDNIILQINGETKTISNNYPELKNILSAQQTETFQVGENIYNIEKIEEANFSIVLQEAPKVIPKYLTGPIPTITQEDIIGRTTELEELEKLLGDSEKVVLVNGLGGIGKTTVARRYLTLHQDKFDHIAFMEVLSDDTETNNSFIAALANNPLVFQNLNLPFDLEQGEEERFASVLSGLQNLEGNNLLLIDNAGKQLESLVNKLPGKPQWQVLVTSRSQLEGFTLYPLDTLSLEKAKELFSLHAGEVDDEELDVLLAYIGCHTLTTELLAKTFKKSITLKSPSQLLELLQNKQLDHKKLAKKIVSSHAQDKEITLYTHLITAFTLAGLEETEIWLLKQFAVMPPLAMEGEFILKVLQATKENEEEIADALQCLVQKGWIQVTKNGQYQIHRIVQEVVDYQEDITFEDCESLIKELSSLLRIDQTKDNPAEKFQWVPFGNRLLLHFSNEENSNISTLENNLALVYKDFGDYQKAAQLLEKALASDQKRFGENHTYLVTTMSNLAMVYKDFGLYEKAKALLEKASSIYQQVLEENHPKIMVVLSNLALVYNILGDHEKSAQLLEKTLSSDKKNFGENHPRVAGRMSQLAEVYQDLGKYQEAKKLLEKALSINIKNFGENHPSVARNMSHLGTIYQDLGFYKEAKKILKKALKYVMQNYDENHPHVATVMSNLAGVYLDLGEYLKALNLFNKVLKINKKYFEENHPTIANNLLSLGSVYIDLKLPEKAQNLITKAYNIYTKSLGLDHPTTKNCKSWLDHVENILAQKNNPT